MYPRQEAPQTSSSSSSSFASRHRRRGSSSSSSSSSSSYNGDRAATSSRHPSASQPSILKWLSIKKTGSWAQHLLARLEAEQRRAQDSDYQAKLQQAAATPINIVVMSGVFWNIPSSVKGCSLDGVPLDCRWSTNKTRVSSRVL
jgi:hypothetical protein